MHKVQHAAAPANPGQTFNPQNRQGAHPLSSQARQDQQDWRDRTVTRHPGRTTGNHATVRWPEQPQDCIQHASPNVCPTAAARKFAASVLRFVASMLQWVESGLKNGRKRPKKA
jgi:hypothetical protein